MQMPIKRYRLKLNMDMADLVDSMLYVINFEQMREICLERRSCRGCQFWIGMQCNRKSTDRMLQETIAMFKKYIEIE